MMTIIGRFWIIKDGKNFLGDGRIALLKNIGQTGSISRAAKIMGMSYKAAWDDVDMMNNLADTPLVVKNTGGKKGGGTELTESGRQLIEDYEQIGLIFQEKVADVQAVYDRSLKSQGDNSMDMTDIIKRLEKGPAIGKNVYIAENATVLGDVCLGDEVSIWHSAALRGDVNNITIGHRSNVQDNAVIHVGADAPVIIGANVTIAHCVCLHGCKIGNNTLIGNGAIVLDGAEIGNHCIVAAGSVVPPGKKFPDGSMIMGNPAKLTRQLTEQELAMIEANGEHYVQYKHIYLEKGL